jgi:hypothetical protein
MTLDAAYASRLRQFADQPPARPAATLGEIWSAEFERNKLDTVETMLNPMKDATDELEQRVVGVTGKTIVQLEQSTGLELGSRRDIGGRIRGLNDLIGRLPEAERKQLEGQTDVVANARTKARQIEDSAANVAGATYGLSGWGTAFAAGVARQMISPVNIALMPLGGPLTGSVPRMLAREAGFGMLGQAVQEPFIAAGREQLGLQNTSIENIIQAGIGQAAFAGVFRAGAAGLRSYRDYRASQTTAFDFSTNEMAAPRAATPFGTGVDGSGRLDLAAGELPVIPDLPGVADMGRRTPVEPGTISDSLANPARLGSELAAPQPNVSFGRFEQSPQLREVATRLEPEDLDAIALLEERNAVLDEQARALGGSGAMTVRDLDQDSLFALPAIDPATVEPQARLFRRGSDQTVREAAKQLEEALAAQNKLGMNASVSAQRNAVAAVQAGNDALLSAAPRFSGDYEALSIPDFQMARAYSYLPGELGNIINRDLPKAVTNAERAALQQRAAQIIDILDRPLTGRSAEELAMLQADAIDEAAAAMERGRVAPQPVAFQPTTVTARVELFTPQTRFDLAVRDRPDLGSAVKAGPDGPFARVFFADDAMTVRVPDDVVQSRIARAAERAASAETAGSPKWTLEAISALAARIDTAPGDLPRIADKPPRQAEAVRVRVKNQSANADAAGSLTSSPKGNSAPSPLTMKQQRVIATVERQLGEFGDVRVVYTGPDGREVTSARALLARVADDEAAVRELDACITSAGAP